MTHPSGHFSIDKTKSEIPQDSFVPASFNVDYITTITVGELCSIVISIGTISSL